MRAGRGQEVWIIQGGGGKKKKHNTTFNCSVIQISMFAAGDMTECMPISLQRGDDAAK